MTKYSKVVVAFTVAAALVIGVTAVAAHPAYTDENNTFTSVVNWFKKGVKIGQQGYGGVTFFNGTIVNDTTSGGVQNPVTFGDDVRIDGQIMRGPWWNEQPLRIADDVEVTGDAKQGRLDEGLVKMTATIAVGGNIVREDDNTTDTSMDFTVTKTATGTYVLSFAPYDISDRYIVITPRGSSTAPTAASGVVSSTGTTVTVYIADVVAGALVDQAFTIAIL